VAWEPALVLHRDSHRQLYHFPNPERSASGTILVSEVRS
jgi:hypothetical protein